MTPPRVPRQNAGLQPPRNLGSLPQGHPHPASAASGPYARHSGVYWWVLGAGFALVSCVYLAKADRRLFLEEEQTYCARVHDGTWPDFDGNYAQRCRAGKPKG